MSSRILIVLALALGCAQGYAKEYLVKLKEMPRMSMGQFANLRVLDQHQVGHLIKLDIPTSHQVEMLANIYSNVNVEYVVPNFKFKTLGFPSADATLRGQWAIQKVNAEKAWTRLNSKGSRNVLVAVIDTGGDYKHESLASNMVAGYDFRDKDADPMDLTSSQNPGHGTHCSGIIGGNGLVSNGIVGISPEVSIMPLRFLGEQGQGDLMDGVKAIDYAISKNVQIISASWGARVSRSDAAPVLEAVKRADDAGITFVVAAGNDGVSNDQTEFYPANAGFPNTITVAASDENDGKPYWSNFGQRVVHLAAPGNNIMSTLPQNNYGNLSGTSMATPLVSGLAALLKSQDSALTGAQIRAVLQTTGAPVQIESACNCRVDADAAVARVASRTLTVVPAGGSVKVGESLQFSGLYANGATQFSVDNGSVASIDASGVLHATTVGDVKVTVQDGAGRNATSLAIHVYDGNGGGGGGGGGGGPTPPGPGGDCPLGDQALCDQLCQIVPLPFCKK